MPSYNRVNYLVRPNKNVQRKLIVEFCASLKPEFPISRYRYIGLGSMWFVDFILMHKALSIHDMVSMEKDDWKRAKFNCPYKCIDVKEGKTSEVLPELDWAKRTIVWLDYDYEIRREVLEDMQFLAQHVRSGSLIIVTNNAEWERFCPKGQPENVGMEKVRKLAKSLLPDPVSEDIWTNEGFPSLVSEILFNQLEWSAINSGKDRTFHPIFSFYYSDGTRMVTTGGMLVDSDDGKTLENKIHESNLSYIRKRQQIRINVPPLTAKEKVHLDQLLPCSSPPVRLKFPLDQEQMENYWKFYLHYPLFSEIAL